MHKTGSQLYIFAPNSLPQITMTIPLHKQLGMG